MTTTRDQRRADADAARTESGTRATRRTAIRATIASICAQYPLSRHFPADIASADFKNQLLRWGQLQTIPLLAALMPDALEDALVDVMEEVESKGAP